MADFLGLPGLAFAVVVLLFAALAAAVRFVVYPLIIVRSARSGPPGPSGARATVHPSGQLDLLPSGLHRKCTIPFHHPLWTAVEFHKVQCKFVRLCSVGLRHMLVFDDLSEFSSSLL